MHAFYQTAITNAAARIGDPTLMDGGLVLSMLSRAEYESHGFFTSGMLDTGHPETEGLLAMGFLTRWYAVFEDDDVEWALRAERRRLWEHQHHAATSLLPVAPPTNDGS